MRRHRKSTRRRHGIGLPAAVTLCIAASLLLFARAGGESTAQQALTALAGNGDFILRAVSLELGLSPDQASGFCPAHSGIRPQRGRRQTRLQKAPISRKRRKTTIRCWMPQIRPPPSPSTTKPPMTVDVAACLASDAAIHVNGDGPQVLIVHTHGSESYTPDAAFPYTPTETERTTDTRYNVVRVGDELQSILQDNGIQTVHIRDIFDSPAYSGSYDRSLAAIEQALMNIRLSRSSSTCTATPF